MQQKYIDLVDQLIQGYHLEKEELDDLDEYLKSHLRTLTLRKTNNLKKYEVMTTKMRKIIVPANSSDEAESIARGQFEDMEEVMMTSCKTNL